MGADNEIHELCFPTILFMVFNALCHLVDLWGNGRIYQTVSLVCAIQVVSCKLLVQVMFPYDDDHS